MRERRGRALANPWLGVKGHPQARRLDHRQIVGPIPHRHGIRHRQTLLRGDLLQQRALARAIDNIVLDSAGERVPIDLQRVGMNLVKTELPL